MKKKEKTYKEAFNFPVANYKSSYKVKTSDAMPTELEQHGKPIIIPKKKKDEKAIS